MHTGRIGPLLLFRPLAHRAACLVAVALMLLFAASVGAAAPQADGVTGTITTGSPNSTPAYYGDVFGFLPPGTTGGVTCDGVYGCPFFAPPFGYGTTYVRGNLYCGLYTCGTVQTIQR